MPDGHMETSPARRMNKKPEHQMKEPHKGDHEDEDVESMLSSFDEDNKQVEEFNKERIVACLDLEFKEVLRKQSGTENEMTTNGLWVIEP